MLLATFEGGPAATNGYLIADREGGSACVIDAPLGTASAMVRQAATWQTPIRWLLNTHGHWDHILDNAALLRITKARFGLHADSEPLLTIPQTRMFGLDLEIEPARVDFYLTEDQPFRCGELSFQVLHCPGHCPGSIVLFNAAEKIAVVGDVLFRDSIGRTDLPGGDADLLMRSIRDKLLPLGDDVRVLPGHGPATTLGRERARNPFLV